MIELREVSEGNPFEDHPQLREIWPQPYLRLAEEATQEEMERRAIDPAQNSGPILLIRRLGENGSEARVIGITGFFIWNEDASELGLRWHGLIPSERGQGLSSQVIDAVASFGAQVVPQARRLMEMVPCSDYGKGIEGHFVKIGFQPHGAPETFDWSDHPWQSFARELAPKIELAPPQQAAAAPPRRPLKP